MHDVRIHEQPLWRWVESASRLTNKTAELPMWRRTNKRTRQLVSVAQQLRDSGRPYLIATPRELCERYPELVRPAMKRSGPDDDRKIVWAVWSSVESGTRRLSIGFMPIR